MDEKILNVLKQVLELNSVDKSCSQANCEKWDSLKHLELVVEIESEFEVELEPEEIAKMKNFENIKKVLQQHK